MAEVFQIDTWKSQGNCVGNPPRLFLYSQTGIRSKKKTTNRYPQDIAKTVCLGCAVRVECREEGRDKPGVWGGLTEKERDAYYRALRLLEKWKTRTGKRKPRLDSITFLEKFEHVWEDESLTDVQEMLKEMRTERNG